MLDNSIRIAVVIPCYKVTAHIMEVLGKIGSEVHRIYVIDDNCPEQSGQFVQRHCHDKRVSIIFNPVNLGVGGAVMAGYKAAIEENNTIIIKIDGDNQMDPSLIPRFIAPILRSEADYTKGNRFFDLEQIHTMPGMRLFGNAVLSFMTKVSSGYWDIFDPTNGYTAIHMRAVARLPLHKISQRYFFESDMLFRLSLLRAVVMDIPMDAKYADEKSNLRISGIIGEFLLKHTRNFAKRIFYNYYLRNMSIASIELPLGLLMLLWGICFGGYHWFGSIFSGVVASTGTVMLSVLTIILGIQFILAFISYDIACVPKRALQSMTIP